MMQKTTRNAVLDTSNITFYWLKVIVLCWQPTIYQWIIDIPNKQH